VRDVDATFAAARARGDKIAAEPRPVRDLRVGFLEDPNGVRIELAQRPQY
jgi:predicted enzyme related to lactoylglutathione lyase